MGDLKEARSSAEAGFALDRSFTIRRYRINAKGDNPAYLAKRERFYEGYAHGRRARGLMSASGHSRRLGRTTATSGLLR